MLESLQQWWGEFEWAPVWGFTPAVIIGLVAAVIAFGLTLWSRSLRPGPGRFLAAFLRAAFLFGLVLLLWNPSRNREVGKEAGNTVFLVDQSGSMSLGAKPRLQEAREWAQGVSEGMENTTLLSFAQAAQSAEWEDLEEAEGTTRLAAALRRAGEEAGRDGQVVILSDGCGQDQRDLPAVLRGLGAKGTRIYSKVIGKEVALGNAWLQDLRVARTAKPGQEIPVRLAVGMDGLADRSAMLRLRDSQGELLHEEEVRLEEGVTAISFAVESGLRSDTWELALEEVENDSLEEDNRVSFPIKVKDPKLAVLYLEGTHAMRMVTSSETSGYWNDCEYKTRAWDAAGDIDWALYTPLSQYATEENLHRVKGFANGRFVFDQARGFPKTRDELFDYDVIICGDIPRGNFSPEQMKWMVEFVVNRGGGFCMIGGYTSFDAGDYDQTPIEKITPVDILYHGYGYSNQLMAMQIPESVRDHPIWQISSDKEQNEMILNLHPAFLGFHDVQRAKPGATLLGLREDGEGALIAVQDYGKGRSMAFLSDTNGGWARQYATWQDPNSETLSGTGHRELGQGADILYKAKEVEGQGPTETPHPAQYVGRFWVNVVRWLGEKSQRLDDQELQARSELMVVEPGGRIRLSAEVLAAVDPVTLPDFKVSAELQGTAEKADLRWDRERREFVGELEVPSTLKGSVVEVAVRAQHGLLDYREQLRLGLLKLDPEMQETAPNEELMKDLAQATGGEVLTDSSGAQKILEKDQREIKAATVSFRQPIWGRWDLFLILVGLLGVEWLLRRYLAK